MAAATMLAGLISLANGGGRACFGFLYDRFSIRSMMLTINLASIASLVVLYQAVVMPSQVLLFAGSICFGFVYGGLCTGNCVFMRSYYGNQHYAGNLTLITFAGGIAAIVGPTVVGTLQMQTGSYVVPMIYLLALGAAALAVQIFVRKP